MATLVLTAAGAALGSAALPGGLSVFGATVTGAQIGALAGGIVGSQIDQALFRPPARQGPRLSDLRVQGGAEGAPILELYGRARVSGQVIWATRFKETSTTTSTGGKGGGGASVTEYSYTLSFAVGLCEGEISHLGRVWADGKPFDLGQSTWRLYRGTPDQAPDPLIDSLMGPGNTPAYRDLAYIVFEDLPVDVFGRRVPQLSFEVYRPIRQPGILSLEDRITAINLIPGSGEVSLATSRVTATGGAGETVAQNVNNTLGSADLTVALDQLQALAPNLRSVSLVVSWFGSDLRAGQCLIQPGVETTAKTTEPYAWTVGGIDRNAARLVTQIDGSPAFGGTPTDQAVLESIADLKARGLSVVFYPFILMDVPPGNTLPDPYTGAPGQPVFPWRGRITCDPAPAAPQTVDKTAAAATQVDALFGAAAPSDFSPAGQTVAYAGPAEWSLRRMILHYAHLCVLAGGVDAFVIGSELRGLTQVRDGASSYPAVSHLQALAADVRSILGPATRITYAADWSEYFGHQPGDGSGDVLFHLDPLWADPAIDLVGIDNYLPLTDWRDTPDHADLALAAAPQDAVYLASNIEGGEGYDWYYASGVDREAQIRTPIVDTAHGEDWLFRPKDLRNWWLNVHDDRPAGVRSAAPTAWVPQSKPIWFTELGFPAVDKGANQPNVFIDPKSSESALPYFSSGARDDAMQRAALDAVLAYWDPLAGNNPVSAVYGGPMIATEEIHIWAWDSRPFPDFPGRPDVWRDAENWRLGHWLTGRLGQADLAALVAALCARAGVTDVDVSALHGLVAGYSLDDLMSARGALEPLMQLYQFDAVESAGTIRFVPRTTPPLLTLATQGLAESPAAAGEARGPVRHARAQETDLPRAVKLGFVDSAGDYSRRAVEAARTESAARGVAALEAAVVIDTGEALARAETGLMEAWVARNEVRFALPPSFARLEPGDVVHLDDAGRSDPYRIVDIATGAARSVRAVRIDTATLRLSDRASVPALPPAAPVFGPADLAVLDLPLLIGDESPYDLRLAAHARPWPGGVDVYRSQPGSPFTYATTIRTPATMGRTTADLAPGPEGRLDYANTVTVALDHGGLESRPLIDMLAGLNAAAVEAPNGAWESLQFATADLLPSGEVRLSGLLRAQAGTEGAMQATVPAGARLVALDPAIAALPLTSDDRHRPLRLRYGPSGRALDDPAYREIEVTPRAVGLRPLSPVHLRSVRDPLTGDIDVWWIRRGRLGADTWSGEIPLGEESEAYLLDILDGGGTAVRSVETAIPSFRYTVAAQTADWGAPLTTSLQVRVAQVSPVYGPGTARTAVSAL